MPNAIRYGSAAFVCILALSCGTDAWRPLARSGAVSPGQIRIRSQPGLRGEEPVCAWFGDRADDVLYFGRSAFWSRYRAAGGDPGADAQQTGPAAIGRFDLASESFLAPLELGVQQPSGTWDVLVHPNGRIYFTTFFGSSGFHDPQTRETRRFERAGSGLAELALLPDGRLAATRYGRDGAVVILDEDGSVVVEHRLAPAGDRRAAPKSLAYDPVRAELWVTTDLLGDEGIEARHDARVLSLEDGSELRRFEDREIQFVAFAGDGRGALAERAATGLQLRLRRAASEGKLGAIAPIALDPHFDDAADFAQEVRFARDDSVVVTRWSGWVHLIDDHGAVESLRLPRRAEAGLYYTTVLRGQRLCATYCAGVTVVCASRP